MGFDWIKARWLATAYFERELSYRQCWQLWNARAAYTANHIDPPTVGNLAVERGLISQKVAEDVESKSKSYAARGQVLRDPVSLPPRKERLKKLATPPGVLAAVLSTVLLIWIGVQSKGDIAITGGAASVVTAAWLLLPKLKVRSFPHSIPLYRPLRWVFLVAAPVALCYCLYTAYQISVLAERVTEQEAIAANADVSGVSVSNSYSMWFRCWTGGAIAGLGLACFLVVSSFRHREIWYLECRIFLGQALIARARRTIEELKQTPGMKGTAPALTDGLLDLTAKIIRLNPWVHELGQLGKLFGRNAGGVSLWYLEPNDADPTKFTEFNIVSISAPGSPDGATNCFGELKKGHHPARYDEDVHRRKIAEYTRPDGTLDKVGFREDSDHDKFVSLAGFVYARQQSETTGNADECLALNKRHREALATQPTDPKVSRWLDFRSLAAFGVQGKADRPLGALLAFKNVRNGFTPADHDVLLTTSRLLGVIRDW